MFSTKYGVHSKAFCIIFVIFGVSCSFAVVINLVAVIIFPWILLKIPRLHLIEVFSIKALRDKIPGSVGGKTEACVLLSYDIVYSRR